MEKRSAFTKATNLPTLLKLEAQEKLFPVNSDNQLNAKSEPKLLLIYAISYLPHPHIIFFHITKATNLPTLLKLEAQEKLFPVNSGNQLNAKSEPKLLLIYAISYLPHPHIIFFHII